MRTAPSARARLVAAGLDPDVASARLGEAGLLGEDGAVDPQLLAAVSGATSPDDALACLAAVGARDPEALREVLAAPQWLARVVAVGGTSRPLGDLVGSDPDALRLVGEAPAIDPDRVAAEVAEAVRSHDESSRAAAVAAVRRRWTAAIAARDLTDVLDVEATTSELSGLAEAILTGAVRALHEETAGADGPAARLGVLGMGKLGGRELNYVSDVDVVFVHEPTGTGEEAARTASAEAIATVTALLRLCGAPTAQGSVYELDTTLRPEGRDGPLSRTPASFAAYWDRYARTWEFQALLKARPVAGDRDLAAALLADAAPRVWGLEPEAVEEIRAMKRRVEAKPEVARDGARQVKLGPGGLRDVEFAVQLLQLVHGRDDERLRVTGTLPALRALADGGWVGEDDAEVFARAYARLRVVEHRLQLAFERRTHTLPSSPERLEWVARACGYRAGALEPARDPFVRDLQAVQAEVRDLHARLFYRPLLEVHAGPAAAHREIVALDSDTACIRLRALGFDDCRAALRDLTALTDGVSRPAKALRSTLPVLLDALADTARPDGGLRALRTVVDAHGPHAELPSLLRDRPPAIGRLAHALGSSGVVGDLLAAVPDAVEWLADTDARDHLPEPLADQALARLAWQDPQAALRRFSRRERLRIVLRDLDGAAGVGAIARSLAGLGDACLEAALVAVLDGGDEVLADVAVLALGRFGGRELHHVSDLDVMFVHAPRDGVDEADAAAFARGVAGRVLPMLSRITRDGTAFEVDADLRPEGASGALSTSLRALERYHQGRASAWERFAMLRARPAAGHRPLARAVLEALRPHVFPDDLPEAEVRALRGMKARIERERVPDRDDPALHIKLGPGGLADVEWTVGLLQRRHGATSSAVRTPSVTVALDALQDEGLIGHEDAERLRGGYRFGSRVRNAQHLMPLHPVDVVPSSTPVRAQLAAVLGYGDVQSFDEDRLRHSRRVRAVTQRLFYGTGGGRRER